MTKKKKPKKPTKARSARSGRYVKKTTAKRNPESTVIETVEKPRKRTRVQNLLRLVGFGK